ncbi:hypothetical protein [Neoroseomonas rubea]|uniref:hypothetical protein n=1 Tax=Neoroseomonas rubea TaxID=2748666 RepID=UPI0018E05888|nr:hypothetical protein [Roseomonas rubea]
MSQEITFLLMIGGTTLLAIISVIAVFFLRSEIAQLRDEKADMAQLAEFRRSFEQRLLRVEDDLRYGSEPRRPERPRDESRRHVEVPESRRQDGFDAQPSIVRPEIAQPSRGIRVPPEPVPGDYFPAHRQAALQPRRDTLQEVLDRAAQALDSAASFNAFADSVKGEAFCVGAGGQSTLERAPSADRGDILVFSHDFHRLAVPGFNLRRNLGLYTSDAGRAAQTRLQWLFDIERGDALAAQPALVDEGFKVRQKGRLLLPFEQS